MTSSNLPKKTDWTPAEIIDLYMEGRQDIEVCKAIGYTKKQFEQKYALNPAFRMAVDRGRDMAEAFWVERSRLKLDDKDFNTALYKAAMGQFYGWAEKVENRNSNINATLSPEEIVARLATMLPEVQGMLTQEQQLKLAQITSQSTKEVNGEYQEISDD